MGYPHTDFFSAIYISNFILFIFFKHKNEKNHYLMIFSVFTCYININFNFNLPNTVVFGMYYYALSAFQFSLNHWRCVNQ